MTRPRKVIRKTVVRKAAPTDAPAASPLKADSPYTTIWYTHMDGTVDQTPGDDVVSGVAYPKDKNQAPVNFTNPENMKKYMDRLNES